MKGFSITCNKCDHKSLHKENVTLHMQASHDNIRYPCDQCDYKVTRKGSLKVNVDSFIRVFNIYVLIVDIQVQQRTTLTDISNQCIKKSMIKQNLKRTQK